MDRYNDDTKNAAFVFVQPNKRNYCENLMPFGEPFTNRFANANYQIKEAGKITL